MKRNIYLDNNATTPVDPQVIQAIHEALNNDFGNPSSIHSFGQESRQQLLAARDRVANYLKVKPTEICFVSSGTEAMNMLIRGVIATQPDAHIISSNVEHSAVYQTLQSLEKQGYKVSYLPTGLAGAVDPDQVQQAIQKDTKLITLMAVNNETGVKTDLEKIAAIAEAHQIPFIVDGVALLGKTLFSIPDGLSAMGFSGHKIHGPKGIGFAFIRSRLKLTPFITGGDQEYGRRGGTENMPGILGLAKAIECLEASLPEASLHMKQLRDLFETLLLKNLSGVVINGQGIRIENTSNLAFEGVDGESLLRLLNQEGVAASHGSACSSGALEPSRVLINMGIPLKVVRSSIRFSMSRMNTREEIESAAAIITNCVNKLSH